MDTSISQCCTSAGIEQLIADEEELHKVFEKIYSQETETIQNLENIPIFVRNKKNNSI